MPQYSTGEALVREVREIVADAMEMGYRVVTDQELPGGFPYVMVTWKGEGLLLVDRMLCAVGGGMGG
jgi:hypothetical protein